MKWAIFLHIYQPPFQDKRVIDQVMREAYLNILKILAANRNLKINLNISGSLTEMLVENGYQDFIRGLKKLAKKGQIEFLASAAYHPILSLVPEEEIERQIKINYNINRKVFGTLYRPDGFFPPEMAYNKKVGSVVDKMGFKYILLAQSSAPSREDFKNQPLKIRDTSLYVFFRDRRATDALQNYQKFKEKYLDSKRNFLITAMDGEMLGHSHSEYHKNIVKLNRLKKTKTIFLKEIFKKRKKDKSILPFHSSWANKESFSSPKIPYPVWDHPKNKVHRAMWKFLNFVIKIVKQVDKKDPGYFWARRNLDLGLSSCSFWWASGNPWWDPDFVVRGATQLIRAVRSIKRLDPKIRLEAEKIFLDIQNKLWQRHWLRRTK